MVGISGDFSSEINMAVHDLAMQWECMALNCMNAHHDSMSALDEDSTVGPGSLLTHTLLRTSVKTCVADIANVFRLWFGNANLNKLAEH